MGSRSLLYKLGRICSQPAASSCLPHSSSLLGGVNPRWQNGNLVRPCAFGQRRWISVFGKEISLEAVTETAADATSAARSATEKVVNLVSAMRNSDVTTSEALEEAAWSVMQSVEKVGDTVGGIANDAVNSTSKVAQEVKTTLHEMASTPVNVADACEELSAAVVEPLVETVKLINTTVEDTAEFLTSSTLAAKDTLNEMAYTQVSYTESITLVSQHIITGVTDTWTWLTTPPQGLLTEEWEWEVPESNWFDWIDELFEKIWSYLNPVKGITELIIYLHDSQHMQWWAAIAMVSICFRALTLPLGLIANRNSARLSRVAKDMRALEQDKSVAMAEPNQSLRTIKLRQASGRSKTFLQSHDIAMWKGYLPLATAPVLMTLFWAVRQMVTYGDDPDGRLASLVNGGALWFTDLTQSDPFMGICIVSAALMLMNGKLAMRYAPPSRFTPYMPFMHIGFAACYLIFTRSFPAGMHVYWFSCMLVTSLQSILVSNLRFRNWFGIPDPRKQLPPTVHSVKGASKADEFKTGSSLPGAAAEVVYQEAQKKKADGVEFADKAGVVDMPVTAHKTRNISRPR